MNEWRVINVLLLLFLPYCDFYLSFLFVSYSSGIVGILFYSLYCTRELGEAAVAQEGVRTSRPVIGRSLVWSPGSPQLHVIEVVAPDEQLAPRMAASAISVWMCVWMGECDERCKAALSGQESIKMHVHFTTVCLEETNSPKCLTGLFQMKL